MKKYILALAVLAFGYTFADAQNLFVDDVVEAPQGGMAKVAIKYQTGGYDLKALQFNFFIYVIFMHIFVHIKRNIS